MKYLFVLNDPPYGTERSYNGIRYARELLKNTAAGNELRVFLIGDAAACAKAGQKDKQDYDNLESMLQILLRHGAGVGVCGTCMDARGMADADLVTGAVRGSMALLAEWTGWADKVIVF